MTVKSLLEVRRIAPAIVAASVTAAPVAARVRTVEPAVFPSIPTATTFRVVLAEVLTILMSSPSWSASKIL